MTTEPTDGDQTLVPNWDEDMKQDAIDWIEQAADAAAGVPEAATVLAMLRAAESRENTVLGMCMDPSMTLARIRDYLLAAR